MVNQQQALRELALFAGAGGGILGGKLLGWETICSVEYNAYARSVLLARQNDGTLAPFPIWDDVRTFDGKPWRGLVDVVSGGFPCQDISAAGKGVGIEGERSGLWSEFKRIIGEVRPSFAYIENSPMLVTRGLDRVLCDIASLGYDAEWGIVSAADCGAPHKRERIWILAYAKKLQRNGGDNNTRIVMEGKSISKFGNSGWTKNVADATNSRIHERWGFNGACKDVRQLRGNVSNGISSSGQEEVAVLAYANSSQREREQFTKRINAEYSNSGCGSWWGSEPDVGRVANGVAYRVDRLKAIGNGQVPRVAATAWEILNAYTT